MIAEMELCDEASSRNIATLLTQQLGADVSFAGGDPCRLAVTASLIFLVTVEV